MALLVLPAHKLTSTEKPHASNKSRGTYLSFLFLLTHSLRRMEVRKSSGVNLSDCVRDSNDDGLASSALNGTGLHQLGFPRLFDIEYLQIEGPHRPARGKTAKPRIAPAPKLG